MRILSLNRAKIPKPGSRQKSFVKTVKELAARDSGGKVVIYEKTGLRSTYLSEIPIADAVDISADIEAALSEGHGGGEYALSVVNRDSEVLAKFNYAISGPPKGRKTASEQRQSAEGAKKRSDSTNDMLVGVMGKVVEAALGQGRSSMDDWTKALEMAEKLGSGNKELVTALLDRSLGSTDNQFENVVQVLDLIHRVGPTLQQSEDSLSSILGAVLPAVIGLLTKRGGGGQIGPAQVHRLEDSLRRFDGKVDPALLAEAHQHLGQIESQLNAAALPGQTGEGVAVAPPSASTTQPQQRQQAVEPTTTGAEVAGPEEEPTLFEILIARFQESVEAGASPRQLAEEIVKIVRTAKLWTPTNPPWLIAGLIIDGYDPAKLQQGLERFFSGIPELAANKSLQEQIKSEIIQVLLELAGTNQPGASEIAGSVKEFLSKSKGEEAAAEEEDTVTDAAPIQAAPAEEE